MKLVSILSFYLLSTFSTLYGKGDNKIITHSFDRAEQQYTAMLKALPEPTAYPRTTDNNGKLRTTPGRKVFIPAAFGISTRTISKIHGNRKQSAGQKPWSR